MNILIAPNSMKGSLNAHEFARIAEKAFLQVSPDFKVRCLPIADGGDHTGPILNEALGAEIHTMAVSDPFGRCIDASMGIAGGCAIIEMAAASGLRLISDTRPDPERATSYGTGQLFDQAIRLGCNKIILGVGGSATVDGGIGLLGALGFRFTNRQGEFLPPSPLSLKAVHSVIFPDRFGNPPEIIVLCDVNNPLLGERGAARVFGPQKGATPEMIGRLEEGLLNWANVLEGYCNRELRNIPGMGAAGGVSCGLAALLNASLRPGADYIFDVLQLGTHLHWADWVITGEGSIDPQSLSLKAPVALALRAKKAGKPVVAIAGRYDHSGEQVFDAMFTIVNGPMSLEESMENTPGLLMSAASQIAGLILAADNSPAP